MYTDPSGHRCLGGKNGDDPEGEDCRDREGGPLINGAGEPPTPKPTGVILIYLGMDNGDVTKLEATLQEQFPGYTPIIVPWTGLNDTQIALGETMIQNQGLSGMPVVIVGFSAGADSALIQADRLTKEGTKPVAVIMIDPTCGRPGVDCTTQINNLRDAGVPVLVIDGALDGIDAYDPSYKDENGNPVNVLAVPYDPLRNSGCYEVDQFGGPAHTEMPNADQTQVAITNFFSHCSP
jgi:hypothetical protein